MMAPNPRPPPSLSGGGDPDHDTSSPLVDETSSLLLENQLERLSDLFEQMVVFEPPPPEPSAAESQGGGAAAAADDDHDDFSPLLDLLQRFPDFFLKEVLERLDPTARASLARTGSAFWDLVFPRSIFPFGLPRAEETTGGVAVRVFKLVDFLGSAERLGVGEGERVPVELADVRTPPLGTGT